MARIRVATTIDAKPKDVWRAIEDIGGHVEWMDDAVVIRFTSDQTSGVGTTYDCETKFGPIRLTDRMEITEWSPGHVMGVRHVGVVTGQGRIILRRARRGRTRVTWDERLRFPWWMGGPVGALVGRAILRRVWRGNLENLTQRLGQQPVTRRSRRRRSRRTTQ